jgi:hypothetical protein
MKDELSNIEKSYAAHFAAACLNHSLNQMEKTGRVFVNAERA